MSKHLRRHQSLANHVGGSGLAPSVTRCVPIIRAPAALLHSGRPTCINPFQHRMGNAKGA